MVAVVVVTLKPVSSEAQSMSICLILEQSDQLSSNRGRLPQWEVRFVCIVNTSYGGTADINSHNTS